MEQYTHLFGQKLQETYDALEKSHIRSAQRRMYICAAECCTNLEQSTIDVNNCIEGCNAPLLNMQRYLKNEYEYVQNRLQRCIMNCNDSVKDKMEVVPHNVTNKTEAQYKQEFEDCAVNCIKKHIEMIPTVLFKIKSTLDKHEI